MLKCSILWKKNHMDKNIEWIRYNIQLHCRKLTFIDETVHWLTYQYETEVSLGDLLRQTCFLGLNKVCLLDKRNIIAPIQKIDLN